MDKMIFKKIFISGVIQGSSKDTSIHSQSYRSELRELLKKAFPDAVIFDPFDGHENSIDYDDQKGRETFFFHIKEVHNSDLLIAYLPHASLGTAIEVWESHNKGIPVWTISPMKTNWVIRFCSDKIFDNIGEFSKYLESGISSK
jgi:nucleoside 2-deoxyribosyltransferase